MIDPKQSTLDESQQPVVEANKGYHLVLASPGCGKTHILAERVKYAHTQGVAFDDMLCLTFTNRAAREMLNRIRTVVDNEEVENLQVGNVHHFCSKFLFDENKVAADTSIIGDEEAVSIIADYRNENEEHIIGNFKRYKAYQEIIFFSHLMFQMQHLHPWKYYLHPECFTDDDRDAVKQICKTQHLEYNEQTVLHIYRNAQQFLDDADTPTLDWKMANKMRSLLWKMYYAGCYEQYKTDHHLMDFEDLLLTTYNIYNKESSCKRYAWIQVDEVQDLNAMQLAIIDLLTAKDQPVVMYLGDEQQAIFSFMGAKVETLTLLKMRCKDNIHHLLKNHRSPKYLLDVFNDYAEKQLNIARKLLPITDNEEKAQTDDLLILPARTLEDEIELVADKALTFYGQTENETTAVIVNANNDADKVSEAMARKSLAHFKVSGRDLFDTADMKLILAHLTILNNERNSLAWTRLLKGMKVFESNALARRFVHKLKELAIAPSDFLRYEDSTYLAEFVKTYNEDEIVVFDTETTGLNVFEDDIIEIAAIKIKHGAIVGEPLDLYIETQKPILEKLGDKENPMYKIYNEKKAKGELLPAAEALQRFWVYVHNATLLGHNANYDATILDHNLQRYANDKIANYPNKCLDSLKIIRLLEPNLPSYKLEALLERFSLVGENSHKAIDDVKATISLVKLCADKASPRLAAQGAFIRHKRVVPYVKALRSAYQDLYLSAQKQLYKRVETNEKAIVTELKRCYEYMLENKYIKEVARLDYVTNYLNIDMVTDPTIPNVLGEQSARYMMDINTMKESDFCNSKSIQERVYVTTIHKAKGLEFDNVIIFDAAKGRYPNALNKEKKADEEDARKFYVGMSRAKRRLYIAYALTSKDRYGGVHNRELTSFMDFISQYFKTIYPI